MTRAAGRAGGREGRGRPAPGTAVVAGREPVSTAGGRRRRAGHVSGASP
jgi:hypothetical protein